MPISEKALMKGQPCPPVEKGKLRLYSMRFDPYAHRAILIMLAKKLPHEIVNIHLRKPPEWFLQKNPAGTVPVLELSTGAIITDSVVVCEYLDDVYGKEGLLSDEAIPRALDKSVIERTRTESDSSWVKRTTTLFEPLTSIMSLKVRDEVPKHWHNFQNNMLELDQELKKRGTKFFYSDTHPGFLDYMMWPFIVVSQTLVDVLPSVLHHLPDDTHPNLCAWIDAMGDDGPCQRYVDYFDLVAFHRAVIMDNDYPYNLGLDI